MNRKNWGIFLFCETLLIVGLLFAKFIPSGSQDFYYMVNGQSYRYFIYTIIYFVIISVMMYNPFEEYCLVRIKSNFITKYRLNLGLPIIMNGLATALAAVFGSILYGVHPPILEVVYSLVALINYLLFISLIYTAIFFRTTRMYSSSFMTVIFIWLLNLVVFNNVYRYDDLIILLTNIGILIIWRQYGSKKLNDYLDNIYISSIKP